MSPVSGLPVSHGDKLFHRGHRGVDDESPADPAVGVGADLFCAGRGDSSAAAGAPDLTTVAPVLKLMLTPTGIMIGWGWEGYAADLDMIELQVDRNDSKGYVPLAFDTTPGYLDTCPQPTALIKWKYRGIYRVGENQVGQWSAEQSLTVGG